VQMIDQALRDIGPFGQVRLVKIRCWQFLRAQLYR